MVVTRPGRLSVRHAVCRARQAATFRQKRDGGPDLWIEGEARPHRIRQQDRSRQVFSKAQVRLLDGSKPTDEVEGEFISYDSEPEFYSVNNTASGESKPGAGRIRATIQPRNRDEGQ